MFVYFKYFFHCDQCIFHCNIHFTCTNITKVPLLQYPESMCSSRHSTISTGNPSECNTPRGSWASSVFDLRNSQGDPLLPALLQPTPANQIDSSNEKTRAQNRQVGNRRVSCLELQKKEVFFCPSLFF